MASVDPLRALMLPAVSQSRPADSSSRPSSAICSRRASSRTSAKSGEAPFVHGVGGRDGNLDDRAARVRRGGRHGRLQ